MLLVQMIRLVRRLRARRLLGIGSIGLLLAIAILGNAITFSLFDGESFGNGLWYSLISVTTIGYGDYSAASLGARIGTIVFIVGVGLSAFSAFFGLVIDWVTQQATRRERGMARAYAKNHTLIVHFPGLERVGQIIRELRAEAPEAEIVIIDDKLETLPGQMQGVYFVKGSSLSRAAYEQADANHARRALILATDYNDPASDAVVASAASVLNGLHPELHIVAECLRDEHRPLFAAAHCDAVVVGLRITGNLLVQEAHDPGVGRTFDMITSNFEGDSIHSVEVTGESTDGCDTYRGMSKTLIDHDLNLLSVVRDGDAHTTFGDLRPRVGDRVVYLAKQRTDWATLASWCQAQPAGGIKETK